MISSHWSARFLRGTLFGLLVSTAFAGGVAASAQADTPTPTPTIGLTPESTTVSFPSPLPTWTPVPSSTPTPKPRITAKAEKPLHRTRTQRDHRPTPIPTRTVTLTPTPAKVHHKRRHRARKKSTATPTPTATPTATPAYNLTAEDSVAPVTCNGAKRPAATHPFLTPPYHGSTAIVSIFDHDSPNYLRDGLTITTTGSQAVPDSSHHRTDFPAYWDASLRQYLDYDGHNGYDFDLSYQPVYAAAAGKVLFAALEYPDAPDHGYGNMVMIDHHNGYVTLYGHFSKLLVKVGQKVKRGQRIGISGNTGHSTGPHLHFTVFHNCTPTDPYGWSGTGEDPLVSYQGETSTYLWSRSPRLLNPLPNWPGLSALPGVPGMRRLLLRLPSTRLGAKIFEIGVRNRAERVKNALGRLGIRAHIDMLRASVDLSSAVTPSVLYRMPYVASIESPDSVDGARSDVLAALAGAELATAGQRAPLAHSRSWTGYLVKLAGRTVLVGRGTKGREVALRLPHGSQGNSTEHLRADSRNGLYAVDLGKLTSGQYRAVALALRGPVIASVHTVARQRVSSPRATKPTARYHGSVAAGLVLSSIIFVLVLVGSAAILRRNRAGVTPDHGAAE
jgi:murein DD-endopeptidase MepM/ murein hydrolase activator NlpD